MNKENLLEYWIGNDIVKNKKIIQAFKKVKRENFVLPEHKENTYDDIALPLIKGSTISQPTTIMIMLEALDLKPGNKVLEIGTGSGYTAALISEIIGPEGKVYTLDIIPELIELTKKNLENSRNIEILLKDGSEGLKEFAPYDRILVNAACKEIPNTLVKQLKTNGTLVLPLGPEYHQKLVKFTKEKTRLKEEILGDFVFVPLQKT